MKVKKLLMSALIAGTAVSVFSCGSGGGSSSSSSGVSLETKSGIAFDGYLKGAVVFADCYHDNEDFGADGSLSSKDPRTLTVGEPTDLDSNPTTLENFNLVVQCNPQKIYVFGGNDTFTNTVFKGVLVSSLKFKNITPITSIIVSADDPDSVKNKIKDVFGVTDTDLDKDYVGPQNPPAGYDYYAANDDFFKFAVAVATAVSTVSNTLNLMNPRVMESVYKGLADKLVNTDGNDIKNNIAGVVAEGIANGLYEAKDNYPKPLPYNVNKTELKNNLENVIGSVLSDVAGGTRSYKENDDILVGTLYNAISNSDTELAGLSVARVEPTQIEFMGSSVNISDGAMENRLNATYDNDNQQIKVHINIHNPSVLQDGTYDVTLSAAIEDRNSKRNAVFSIGPLKVDVQGGAITDISPYETGAKVARLSVDGTDTNGNKLNAPVQIEGPVLKNIIKYEDCGSDKCVVFDVKKALEEIRNQGNITPSHPLYNVSLIGYFDLSISATGELPIEPIVGSMKITQ